MKKYRYLINILMIIILVENVGYFIYKDNTLWSAISSFTLGAWIVLLIAERKFKRTFEQPEVIISGTDYNGVMFGTLSWLAKGFRVVSRSVSKKYWLFGETVYTVGLSLPTEQSQAELTDEELEQ